MSAIAVYFVFSYRLWRKPSHHIAFPMSVLDAYGLPLQSGNLFPSVLSKRDKLLPHGGEHDA